MLVHRARSITSVTRVQLGRGRERGGLEELDIDGERLAFDALFGVAGSLSPVAGERTEVAVAVITGAGRLCRLAGLLFALAEERLRLATKLGALAKQLSALATRASRLASSAVWDAGQLYAHAKARSVTTASFPSLS